MFSFFNKTCGGSQVTFIDGFRAVICMTFKLYEIVHGIYYMTNILLKSLNPNYERGLNKERLTGSFFKFAVYILNDLTTKVF